LSLCKNTKTPSGSRERTSPQLPIGREWPWIIFGLRLQIGLKAVIKGKKLSPKGIEILKICILFLLIFSSCTSEETVPIPEWDSNQKDNRVYQLDRHLLNKTPSNSPWVTKNFEELHLLLKARKIDYFFSYRYLARKQDLKFLTFPDEINLSNPEYESFYRRSSVALSNGTIKKGSAKNEIVLVFEDQSKYREKINQKNWYEILLEKDVRFGRCDLEQDLMGADTIIVWKLAKFYYGLSPKKREIYLSQLKRADEKGKKDLLKIYVNGKAFKGISRREFKEMYSKNFSKKGFSLNRGTPLQSFFSEIGLNPKPRDEIFMAGSRKSANVTYQQVLDDQMSFVLSRKGTPKLVAAKGEYSKRRKGIGHIRELKIKSH
jgi:ABC-type molybdate transport system substrate-binding protein